MERTLQQARNGELMNAEQVRAIIETMNRDTKSRAARKAMASAAVNRAKVTEEGRAVWADYLATFD